MDPSSTREGYFDPPSGGKDDRLRELELRYRGIIDQLPAVLYVDGVNEDEPMIDVSPSVIDLLGIPREQFLSRPYAWADTIHPEDLDRVTAESERVGSDGRTVQIGVPGRAPGRPHGVGPRGRGADRRRGGQAAPLARLDARRHRAHQDAGRAPRGQVEVRSARGADPGDRLRGRRGRQHVDDVREPADRSHPRLQPAGVHRRSPAVGEHPAPRRPRGSDGDVPAWARVRWPVRLRISPSRSQRQDGLVPRQCDRPHRRERPGGVHPGRDARHHRRQAGGGAHRVPRVSRQDHGTPEPNDVRRAPRSRARTGEAAQPRRGRRDGGPRRLQVGERLPRPRSGQRAARASSRSG